MKKVEIFTSPTCPHCRTAKNYLTSRKIPFRERDVSRDASAGKEMARLNIMGVPAFVIDGEVIIGFDQKRIEKLLSQEIVKCPVCGTSLRLPSGKGKLRVTCTSCGEKFETVT